MKHRGQQLTLRDNRSACEGVGTWHPSPRLRVGFTHGHTVRKEEEGERGSRADLRKFLPVSAEQSRAGVNAEQSVWGVTSMVR